MIHMDPGNRIVAETIRSQIDSETRYAVDVTAADHNDVMYKVVSELDSKHLITVSVYIPAFAEVLEQVGEDWLAARYGELLRPTAEQGHSFSLQIDLDALAAAPAEEVERVIDLASCMRRDIEGAPLWLCFEALLSHTASRVPRPLYSVHSRPDEPMFVVPSTDRVVVVFALNFADRTELALAGIFVQEMEVVRRTERALATAPLVSLSQRPPLELEPFALPPPASGAPLGYLSLALGIRHLEGPGRLAKAVGLLGSYRSYILYHVKCAKSAMHSRMRARVNTWLQVLNRAVPDRHTAERKTIQGRTFKRTAPTPRAGSAGADA